MELNWKVRHCHRVRITPDIASDWLAHRNRKNRLPRPLLVAKYAADMLEGRWQDNGQAIQFDWDGQLINGQHRLQAICKSRTTLPMDVVTGLSPEVRSTVDTHGKRSFADALREHIDLSGRGGSVGANTAAGMWHAMRLGLLQSKGKMTHLEALQFAHRYADGGMFALTEMGRHKRVRSVSVAPVIAAVARAFYHYPEHLSRLADFCTVLASGYPTNGHRDRVVILLREYLIARAEKGVNSNGAHELYGKTARAIQAWMRGEALDKLYRPSVDPFPLPERASASAEPDRVAGNVGRLFDGEPRADCVAQMASL